jgi:hypothetical protein
MPRAALVSDEVSKSRWLVAALADLFRELPGPHMSPSRMPSEEHVRVSRTDRLAAVLVLESEPGRLDEVLRELVLPEAIHHRTELDRHQVAPRDLVPERRVPL